MKRAAWVIGVAAAVGGAWLVAQQGAGVKPLSELTPAGAVVYVEAKNLGGLVTEWNGSPEKTKWLASANYQVFTRSRLLLRLQQVFEEYAAGVGVPPDMNLLTSVAGGESALAIYDINKLEALYITRLASARAMESVLWKAKEQFTARTAAGQTYYTKTDGASKRTASFAIVGDLLLAATREEALTGALALVGSAQAAPVRREPWFDEALQTAQGAGELRLVLNMEKLVRAPAFRSYWVQNNVSDLREFRAGIADVSRVTGEVREQRALLRPEAGTAVDAAPVRNLLRLVRDPGLYRAWAQPEPEFTAQLIGGKILRPGMESASDGRTAPSVSMDAIALGNETDLETRLDAAPYDPPGAVYRPAAVLAMLKANRPKAVLQLQSTPAAGGQVFLKQNAVIAVEGTSNWNAAAVKTALQEAVEGLHTTAKLGVQWRAQTAQNQSYEEMDGLAGIAIAVRGSLLLIASRGDALVPVLAQLNAAPALDGGSYVAGYRLTGELDAYGRMMRMINFAANGASSGGPDQEPDLFADNLASLARTLDRVQGVNFVATDDGRALRQTVRYRLRP